MIRYPILAGLAGALLASPLQAAPGDIPEKRLFGNYDRKEVFAPKPAPVETRTVGSSTAPATRTASNTSAHKTHGKTPRLSPGNERIAHAIAKGALAEHGIHNPTQEQLKAALNGGTVTTKGGQRVTLPGVLKLRASGMGWGLIAQKHGFKLGEVMRHDHKDKHHKHAHKRDDDDKRHHKHAHHKHRDKHEHADWKHHGRPHFHWAKYERPEKFERPHKHERPERPERPERHGRGR